MPAKTANQEAGSQAHETHMLARLEARHVAVPNPVEVQACLDTCPDIAELLPLICEQARKEFGAEVELSLELYRDPETQDGYLTLYIRQPQYEADIIERIDWVMDKFADQLDQTSGYVLLTTDFRPPRGNDAV